jgi:hypothetical protein
MRRLIPVLLTLTLGACDLQKPISGEWEVVSTMGSPNRPSARAAVPESFRRCVDATDRTAQEVILAMTSKGRCDDKDAHIRFGRIGGALHCPGSYDIRDYDDRLAGNYGPRTLHMTADMPLFGTPIRQTFDARRVGPCPAGAWVPPKKERHDRRARDDG